MIKNSYEWLLGKVHNGVNKGVISVQYPVNNKNLLSPVRSVIPVKNFPCLGDPNIISLAEQSSSILIPFLSYNLKNTSSLFVLFIFIRTKPVEECLV